MPRVNEPGPWPVITPGPASAKAPLVIDLDATLINVHSEKEQAAPTFKRGFGYHPLCAFLDHGQQAPGNPSPSPCARATRARTPPAITSPSLARLSPSSHQPCVPGTGGAEEILIRTDGASGTKGFIDWLTTQRLGFSVGFTLPAHTPDLLERISNAWFCLLLGYEYVLLLKVFG